MKMVLQQRGARLAEERSEEMSNGDGVAAGGEYLNNIL